MSRSNKAICVLLGVFTIGLPCIGQTADSTPTLNVIPYPLQSDERARLTADYAKRHYGLADSNLTQPLMIVIHFTATGSLEHSLETFLPARLTRARSDIAGHGDVNVGVHYLIAKDGGIYSLLEEGAMGRHAIGFNWCSLGIELVAKDQRELTKAQLESAATLVAGITRRLPSIRYLVGHHEYMDKTRPHFALYRELDKNYTPTVKTDPGAAFMADLRKRLHDAYHIDLLD